MKTKFPFASTYSIVARDPISGNLGVAVQSHWFSVGSLVGWAEAGVGVVATQSMVDVSYGPLGLTLMKAGKTPSQALAALLAADENPDVRQVAMVSASGNSAVHTGKRCIPAAGHIQGDGFCVQANMMVADSVWPAMHAAYLSSKEDFSGRLMAALFAAQQQGGDIRGKQSAAIIIVAGKTTGNPWQDRIMDLRVEDHQDPLGELSRLIRIHAAYQLMNAGDEYLTSGDTLQALVSYRNAKNLAPEISELPFWHAVTLAQLGQFKEAQTILADLFREEPNWRELLARLPQVDLLSIGSEDLSALLSQTHI